MKILVTGGLGFVGKHVTAALRAANHEVIAPSSRELNLVAPSACSGLNGGPIQFGHPINGPLAWIDNSIQAIEFYLYQHKPDAIVHLAAICGGIGINKDNPGRFMYENLQMGLNVVEACRLANIKKLVNLSTVCSYPKHTPIPFQEKDIWNGYPEETNAPYGIAKKTIMELGIAYSQQYGMNITNLVPVNMAGEYDHFDLYSSHVLPALIRKFEEAERANYDGSTEIERYGVVELWGTGSASREFLYAGDCAEAIVKALNINTGPEPINLGTGQEITIKELADIVKKVGGYNASIVWDDTKPNGQPRRCLDVSRAKEKLDWQAKTPIKITVQRTIDWYRENV